MDTSASAAGLPCAPIDVVTMVLQTMCYKDRFTCALVCKAWAKAATAATRSITLRHSVRDLSCLQRWLERHGAQIEVVHIHKCDDATLTAMPCAQLQSLLLEGVYPLSYNFSTLRIDSEVWGYIAAATKLTSVSLTNAITASEQADVVAALIALPDLQHLTWSEVQCSSERCFSDSSLLQHLTQLTSLNLGEVSAKALQHLGSLTKLQHLRIAGVQDWGAGGCPGLQELKALSSCKLSNCACGTPDGISQLTALQQLHVSIAAPAALYGLQVVSGLTKLCVEHLEGLSAESPPLQLPGLQHLVLNGHDYPNMPREAMPATFLAGCTQLRVLELWGFDLRAPGNLIPSTLLQHLKIRFCRTSAADGAADPVTLQHVFPGTVRLPHLTSLELTQVALEQSDIECIVACCSSLQVLQLDTLPDNSAPALACLSGLTSLGLAARHSMSDQVCISLAQLTGLRELTVFHSNQLSTAGLRQLAALEQLTSLCFGCGLSHTTVSHIVQALTDERPGYALAIVNKAPAGSPPDVAARLLQACNMAAATDC